MTENASKLFSESALAELKKTDDFLKRMNGQSSKKEPLQAKTLKDKNDKDQLSGYVITAMVRLQKLVDLVEGAMVDLEKAKHNSMNDKEEVVELQKRLIISQDEQLQKMQSKVQDTMETGFRDFDYSAALKGPQVKSVVKEIIGEATSTENSYNKKAVKQACAEANSEEVRKRSVIIHGLNGGLGVRDLKAVVSDLLINYVDCSYNRENIENVFYLGKIPETPKARRPVKVTFDQRFAAAETLEQSVTLQDYKTNPARIDYCLKQVYINPDRSYSDRQKIRELVIDLKEKKKEQPNISWRINYKKLEVVQYEHLSRPSGKTKDASE